MLFGIKIFENRAGLKKVNESLNKYGSAIMFGGSNTGIFLTSHIEALKVAFALNKRKNYFRFKVYRLKDWEESRVNQKDIARTYKEYFQLSDKRFEDATRMLNELLEEKGLAKPKQETDTEAEK